MPSQHLDATASITRHLNRRQLFKAVGLAGAVTMVGSACSAQASSGSGSNLDQPTVQLLWIKNVQFAGSFIADDRGYYKEEGVDPVLAGGGPNVNVVSSVLQGTALMGIDGYQNIANARAEGADLVVVAAGYQHTPLCILSPVDAPLVEPADMIGKKIGVPNVSTNEFNGFLSANQIDPSQVQVVPVQFDPSPLMNREVDGYYGFVTTQPVSLELQGFPTVQMRFSDYGLDALSELYVVRKASLDDAETRATIVSLLRGEVRGWQDQLADPQLGVQLVMDKYGAELNLSAESQAKEAVAQNTLVSSEETDRNGLLTMSEARIAETLEALRATGGVGDESMFDTSVLEEVYQGRTSL